jgi:hypothetical protein
VMCVTCHGLSRVACHETGGPAMSKASLRSEAASNGAEERI